MTVSIKRERYIICSSFCEIVKKKTIVFPPCYTRAFTSGAKAGAARHREAIDVKLVAPPRFGNHRLQSALVIRGQSAFVSERVCTARQCTVVRREHARERCNRERRARYENGVVTERECCRSTSRNFHKQRGKARRWKNVRRPRRCSFSLAGTIDRAVVRHDRVGTTNPATSLGDIYAVCTPSVLW